MSMSAKAAGIFLGLTFWVSKQIPERSRFLKSLQNHGATVVTQEKDAHYLLFDPDKLSDVENKYHDYKWIADSIDQNELLDCDEYEITSRHPAKRPVGSVSTASKGTRTKFTAQDDQLLYNWVEPLRRDGAKIKGNVIYEQLALKYPHHTYQSWRDRYLNFVQYNNSLRITENFVPATGDGYEVSERPPKRRRVDDTESPKTARASRHPVSDVVEIICEKSNSERTYQRPTSHVPRTGRTIVTKSADPVDRVLADSSTGARKDETSKDSSLFCTPEPESKPAHSKTRVSADVELDERSSRRQGLSQARFGRSSMSGQGFDYNEASRLYFAVPEICTTSPTRLKDCWRAMAKDWTSHTGHQWEECFHSHILPEYRRANNLNTQAELESHVADVIACKQDFPLSGQVSEQSTGPSAGEMINENLQYEEEHNRQTKQISRHNVRGGRSNPRLDRDHLHVPSSQHVGATANEGRKRITQPIEDDTAHSSPVPEIVPSPSQKKKLFGRVLALHGASSQEQSTFATQPELTNAQVSIASSIPVQSNISSSSKTNTTGSSSLPTAQKPPHSFQIPPKSLTTSQESAGADIASRAPNASQTNIPDQAVLPQYVVDLEDGSPVDLINERDEDQVYLSDEKEPSDTGSEYLAFETAPERGQLWEADPHVEEEREVTEPSESDWQVQPRPAKRQATPVRRHASVECTDSEDDDEAAEEFGQQRSSHKSLPENGYIETQALFKQPTQEEPDMFDLPDPDGGWESMGIIAEDDPDLAVETVELPDGSSTQQRRPSSLGNSGGISTGLENVVHEGQVDLQPHDTGSILPHGVNETNLKTADNITPQAVIKMEDTALDLQSHELQNAAPSPRASQPGRLAGPAIQPKLTKGFVRNSQGLWVARWVAEEQNNYPTLPDTVFKRLAATAAQAVNASNETTATLLLEKLVKAFLDYEAQRQADYKSSHPGTRKRLKALTSLSSVAAKDLLPKNIKGVWTPEDDNLLTNKTLDSIMRSAKKHGQESARARLRFLTIRHDLPMNAGPARSTTDGTSRSIQKRIRR